MRRVLDVSRRPARARRFRRRRRGEESGLASSSTVWQQNKTALFLRSLLIGLVPKRLKIAIIAPVIILVCSCSSDTSIRGGDWPGYGGDNDETHYSPLNQISDSNIDRLGLAWWIDLDASVSSHSAPVAVDGKLYFSTGYSKITAVDGATGRVLWQYDPKVVDAMGDEQRAAWGVRGIAYGDGKIFTGTQDGRLIAIDAASGALAWSVQTREHGHDGRYITGAPRFFDGKVIIGHGGADYADIRGYVTTYDANSGKQLWRVLCRAGQTGREGWSRLGLGHADGRENMDRGVVEIRRWRHGLECDHLRRGIEPHLYRHGKRCALEP